MTGISVQLQLTIEQVFRSSNFTFFDFLIDISKYSETSVSEHYFPVPKVFIIGLTVPMKCLTIFINIHLHPDIVWQLPSEILNHLGKRLKL